MSEDEPDVRLRDCRRSSCRRWPGLGGFFNNTADPLTGAPGAGLRYLIVGLMAWPEGTIPRLGTRGGQLGLLGLRGARIVFSVLWGGFAVLWLLPANDSANAVDDALGNVPTGAGWFTSLLGDTASATAGHGTVIALALAAISGLIAFAVARDWHMCTFLWISIAVDALFWCSAKASVACSLDRRPTSTPARC